MVKGRYTYYIERGISAQGQGQKHMVCTKYLRPRHLKASLNIMEMRAKLKSNLHIMEYSYIACLRTHTKVVSAF